MRLPCVRSPTNEAFGFLDLCMSKYADGPEYVSTLQDIRAIEGRVGADTHRAGDETDRAIPECVAQASVTMELTPFLNGAERARLLQGIDLAVLPAIAERAAQATAPARQ